MSLSEVHTTQGGFGATESQESLLDAVGVNTLGGQIHQLIEEQLWDCKLIGISEPLQALTYLKAGAL